MMDIPRDMKGLEKSITSSRTKVMVRGATAMSAFYSGKGQCRAEFVKNKFTSGTCEKKNYSPRIPILQPSHSRFWSLHPWLHISHLLLFLVDIWIRSALLSLQLDPRSNPHSARCPQRGQHSFSAWHMELPEGQRTSNTQQCWKYCSAQRGWILKLEALHQGDRSLIIWEGTVLNKQHPFGGTLFNGCNVIFNHADNSRKTIRTHSLLNGIFGPNLFFLHTTTLTWVAIHHHRHDISQHNTTFTKMVVTMTVLFSIPVVSFAKTSDLVTAILSTSFQYPICGKEEKNPPCD